MTLNFTSGDTLLMLSGCFLVQAVVCRGFNCGVIMRGVLSTLTQRLFHSRMTQVATLDGASNSEAHDYGHNLRHLNLRNPSKTRGSQIHSTDPDLEHLIAAAVLGSRVRKRDQHATALALRRETDRPARCPFPVPSTVILPTGDERLFRSFFFCIQEARRRPTD